MMDENRFHISRIFLSLFNILAWLGFTYWYVITLIFYHFFWTLFLYLVIYIPMTYILFINSVGLIIEELKKLGKKSE